MKIIASLNSKGMKCLGISGIIHSSETQLESITLKIRENRIKDTTWTEKFSTELANLMNENYIVI